jgi:tetrahydromethanopterin S-methyltransferase subunit G
MNHRQKRPKIFVRNPAWRRAFQRLDETLDQNSDGDNSELIERIGKHMFGDLWRERENTQSTPENES